MVAKSEVASSSNTKPATKALLQASAPRAIQISLLVGNTALYFDVCTSIEAGGVAGTAQNGSGLFLATAPEEEQIPALLFDSNGQAQETADVSSFLRLDLDVRRLNCIHKHLWLAGRPTCARSLSHQVALNRTLLVVERADLHLLWVGSIIYLKPLPAYILSLQNLEQNPPALSLLVSYLWLIRHQSDLGIAKKYELTPASLTWKRWVAIYRQYHVYLYRFDLVEPRYQYGELRLSRVNWIYILTRRSGPRGYGFGENQVGSYFARNFGWLAGIFAYLSIILSAMQVGLGTNKLAFNESFQGVSTGFTVFALVLPLAVAAGALLLYVGILVSSVTWAYSSNAKAQECRGILRGTASRDLEHSSKDGAGAA
ncbi:hypothetical protein LTR17_023443 [Elasticomyces elasticus]|nr:hypothetical protein LTR17_023443 [Elasticomyces elasticus]